MLSHPYYYGGYPIQPGSYPSGTLFGPTQPTQQYLFNPNTGPVFSPPMVTPKPTLPTRYPTSGGGNYLSQILSQIQAMPSTATSTVSGTTTAQQAASPELEAAAKSYMDMLNQIATEMRTAYAGQQASYGDLLTSLASMFGAQSGRGAQAVQTSALGAGFTPMEASQQGQQASLQALQAYYPQKAALQTEASGIPVALQGALAGLQRGAYLPFMQGVMAPYYQGVAGTTTEQEQTQTVPQGLEKASLMSQIASAISQQQLQQQQYQQQAQQQQYEAQLQAQQFQQQLAQQAQQFETGTQLDYAKLAQQAQQYQQQSTQQQQQFAASQAFSQQQLAQQAQQFQASQAFEQMMQQSQQAFSAQQAEQQWIYTQGGPQPNWWGEWYPYDVQKEE